MSQPSSDLARSAARDAGCCAGPLRPRSGRRTLTLLVGLAVVVVTGQQGGRARAQCEDQASFMAASSLLGMSDAQAAVADATLTSLTGAPIDLSAAEYDELASTQLSLDTLLGELQKAGAGASAAEALSADIALETLFEAAEATARASGSGAAGDALGGFSGQTAGLSDSVSLADFLMLGLAADALEPVQLGALELVMAAASAFNARNVTTGQNVHIDPSEAGLGSEVSDITLDVVSVDAPQLATGPVGTTVISAPQRVRVHLGLSGAPIGLDVVSLGLASAELSLVSLDYIVVTQSGTATLTALDALASTATVRATPGVSSLLLGTLSDEHFYDRSTAIAVDTELMPASLGSLSVTLLGGLVSESASVNAKSAADGAGADASNLNFEGGFPQTQTAGAQSGAADGLSQSLLENTQVNVGGFSGALGLSPSVSDALGDLVAASLTASDGALADALSDSVETVADSAMEVGGVRIGELDVTVARAFAMSMGTACDDGLFCTVADACDGLGACVGEPRSCPSDGLTCTAERCDETEDRCETSLAEGCLIDAACWPEGGSPAGNACQVCVPGRAARQWSYLPSQPGCDSDGDGLNDAAEQGPSGEHIDHDGDGTPDHLDPDDDGDSLPTQTEHADPNGDGDPSDARDLDGDSVPDYLDPDDDADGRSTQTEVQDASEFGGDDVDDDGVPNWYDTDSDGDGVLDVAENYGDGDLQDDGIPDSRAPDVHPNDSDSDGIPDEVECGAGPACVDTDDDGLTDPFDDDDDGDGVLTLFERPEGLDQDTDGDAVDNHLDPDDDGDTLPTRDEHADPNGDGNPSDARDLDDDGTKDYLDADDDDDGRLTRDEIDDALQLDDDVDEDGLRNWYDDDSDGDGHSDADENAGDGDRNDDGVPDYLDPNVGPGSSEGDAGAHERATDAGSDSSVGGLAGGVRCAVGVGAGESSAELWTFGLCAAALALRRRRA